ncbi:hypothetical protein [Flavobacterium sp.]|uniref:hypothetical protein n=1 Tax=Flavobacterium sp. TaxID=239 RepID=UPI002B4AADD7|nr:hypothetical protein [Flavobacterium sp.]HLP63130.1 hypothetical protein [Flavobacterium sp.]
MFSFFKKNKVTINSISFPNFDWDKIENTEAEKKWINPEQSTLLSLSFFNIKPNLPTVKNLEFLKSFFRESISAVNGGLVNVEIINLNTIPTVKTIFKVPQEETGMIYLGSLIIPFEDYSFVIKIQSNEVGTTGLRDTVVLNELLEKEEITFGEEGIENWFSDPYDVNFKKGTLMNKSDDEKYDNEFINHPLTIVRSLLNKIIQETTFNPEIESIARFDK